MFFEYMSYVEIIFDVTYCNICIYVLYLYVSFGIFCECRVLSPGAR